MNNPDHISESLKKHFLGKNTQIFLCGSRMEKVSSGIRDKHPGSATLDINIAVPVNAVRMPPKMVRIPDPQH
jgi:hypothetical protein